jgi:hypothetical protein
MLRTPRYLDSLMRVLTINGLDPIGVSLFAISLLPLQKFGALIRDMSICDGTH